MNRTGRYVDSEYASGDLEMEVIRAAERTAEDRVTRKILLIREEAPGVTAMGEARLSMQLNALSNGCSVSQEGNYLIVDPLHFHFTETYDKLASDTQKFLSVMNDNEELQHLPPDQAVVEKLLKEANYFDERLLEERGEVVFEVKGRNNHLAPRPAGWDAIYTDVEGYRSVLVKGNTALISEREVDAANRAGNLGSPSKTIMRMYMMALVKEV